MIELTGAGMTDRAYVGGKAHYLDRLMGLGLNVPPTIVIPVDEAPDAAEITNWCRRVLGADSKWRLAIRSSSFFEDSGRESQAGHYLSLLGTFDIFAIEQAIEQVRESGPRMAVIIQPLLDASYAGVLFSCDPLSYSKDELTIVGRKALPISSYRVMTPVSGFASAKVVRFWPAGGLPAKTQ